MNKATTFVAFLVGAAAGSAVAWYYTKKKYEQIAQEEIDSVKATFTAQKLKYEGPNDSDEASEEAEKKAAMNREKPSIAEYAKMLHGEGYTDYSKAEPIEEEPVLEPAEENVDVDADEEEDEESLYPGNPERHFGDPNAKPYVISPDEFGEFEDYDKITLSYCSDHIVIDENDEIVEDVEGSIGFESLAHFGEYEDDSVHVRNDRLKVDYEILLDQRTYSDILKSKPYLMEDE